MLPDFSPDHGVSPLMQRIGRRRLETGFNDHQRDRGVERDGEETSLKSSDSLALSDSGEEDNANTLASPFGDATIVAPTSNGNPHTGSDTRLNPELHSGADDLNLKSSDPLALSDSDVENGTNLHTGSIGDEENEPIPALPASNAVQTDDTNLHTETRDKSQHTNGNTFDNNEADAVVPEWSNRRLRPRTQQQLNPYKYDYYQYDRAIRGSGMKPVRLKEYMDSSRAVFAAEDDDLPYEPPEEEESQEQVSMDISTEETPLSVNRRRRVIMDDDEEDYEVGDTRLKSKKSNRPTKKNKKKPETVLPSLITADNIPKARNEPNTPGDNKRVNGIDGSNIQKGIARRKIMNMKKGQSGENSETNSLNPIGSDDDPIELGSDSDNGILNITEDEPNRDLPVEDPFNFTDDIFNFQRNDGLFRSNNISRHLVEDKHEDSEVIESDWIDPMLSRASQARRPLSSVIQRQKKAVNRSIPKLSISTVRTSARGKTKPSIPKGQTQIEQFSRTGKVAKKSSAGPRKTTVQWSTSNDKFLPEEGDVSDSETPHQLLTTGSSSRSKPPPRSRILAELQKSRPELKTSIVEAESGRFAIRRTKTHRANIRSAVNKGVQRGDTYLSSKELTPLPGELDHGFITSLSDDDYLATDAQHKIRRLKPEISSWSTVTDIFQTPFNARGFPSQIIFSSNGLVGSGLLDMMIEQRGVQSLVCPTVYNFGSEFGTLDLNETDIYVSEKLVQIAEVIKGWVKFSLHSPSESRPYRIEQLYEFGIFLLKSLMLERLANTEKQKVEDMFMGLVEFVLGQWENIPYNLRSMQNDFPVYSLIISTFCLLFEYLNFCSGKGVAQGSLSKCASSVANNLIHVESESFRIEYRKLLNKTDTVIRPHSYFELTYAVIALLNSVPSQSRPRVELSFFGVLAKEMEVPPFSMDTKAYISKLWGYILAYSMIGTLWNCPNKLNRWDLVSSIGKSLMSTFSDQEWYVKQMRIFLSHCLYLMNAMKWPSAVSVVRLLYRFYSSSERKFRNIEADGNTSFPGFFDKENMIYVVRPSDSVFHLFLKLTAITILTLKRGDDNDLRTLKSLSGNIRPLGFRKLNRDCRLDTHELEALCNDFSIYLTLYRFCPKTCGRPSIPQLRDRLNLKESHILARKISLKAWYIVMKMTGDNGGLEEVMEWFDDLLEDSLREHEQCQNDVELEAHFKNINVKAYEDFLTVTIRLLPLILGDTNLLLRIPDWYRIMGPKIMSVLSHRLPLDIKELIMKAVSTYISSSEQITALRGGMEDDSQESPLDTVNPCAPHFSKVCLESLHRFVGNILAMDDVTDTSYEGVIDVWANAAKFLVKHNQRVSLRISSEATRLTLNCRIGRTFLKDIPNIVGMRFLKTIRR